MLSMLSNLFLGRRRRGLAGLIDRRRYGGIGPALNRHRGASALGTIAMIAAPFVISKVRSRRAQHQQEPATA